MIPKKFVPLVLIALSIFSSVPAQVNTNTTALRATAIQSGTRYQEMRARLLRLSKQNGWPLSVSLKQGNRAVLYGIDPSGKPLYVSTTNNIISAATIGTNQLWPGGSTGLNLNGSSAALKGRIALWDGGRVRGTHQELNGRVLQKDAPSALNDHSTHVSGTLIAAGVNPSAKGMSFGAQQLLAYDFNDHITEMLSEAPNLLISNHSYGTVAGWNLNTDNNHWEFYGDPGDTADYKFGYYSDEAQAWDSIAYDAPYYLIVKSAGNNRDVNGPEVGQPYYRPNSAGTMIAAGNRPPGISNNDGYDIIPTYGIAKNIISVGAVNPIPGGYSTPADVVLAEFSSWGPADDGRIKPDLVADGVNVLSSISTSDNAYAIYSGTSMSSPAAAGSSFLLQEYYAKLHSGAFMRSATLKGILIHTADEAGPANGPDYQFGYGLIDMPKAASVITSNNTDQLINENNLTNGNSFSLPVVASGKGPLVVTLSWTDPAGKVDENNVLNNPARKLINDLDLRVTGNSTTYTPWILDRRNPGHAATNGDDTLNNVEKIEINNAIAGKTYTIQVTHKGTLEHGAQAYSLITSGVGGEPYCVSAATSSAGTRIDQVAISNLTNNNPVGCTTYTDYSSKTISLQSSQATPFTVKLSSCDASTAQRVVKIFIDYNNNGTFTDPGETAAVSTVLAGGAVSYSGTIQVPAGMKIGGNTLMRIVAQETTDTAAVHPCGSYGNGETEDFRVQFVALANDLGVSDVVDPLPTLCQTDSERISVRIKNTGTNSQDHFPISLKVSSGGVSLIDVNTIYPDTVIASGSAIYTFQPTFKAEAGKSYNVIVSAQLGNDQDTANNGIRDTLTVTAGNASTVTGNAEICNDTPPKAGLKANITDSSDAIFWYDTPTAVTPIAAGVQASTSVIPSDKTYYLGLNDLAGTIGPKTKLEFPDGGYNNFQGNLVRFTNNVPLTISSTRLYVGNGGKVTFMVADLASFDSCSGAYSYYPISSNTIDVYPTTPNPQAGAVNGNSASDTGAVFLLNLAVPTPGNHVLIVVADNNATLFRNNNISSNPYPVGVPGVFSITGNSAIDLNNCKDTSFYHSYYYFFYDLKLTLNHCPSPRIPVVAKTPTPVTITLNDHLLSSNYPSGNQWYRNDTLIVGATLPTDSVFIPGTYKDVVNDSLGCMLVSKEVVYTLGDNIGLQVSPNPNHGAFHMQFYIAQSANVGISVVNTLGEEVYKGNYPNFGGFFSRDINIGSVSAGTYVVKVQVGGKKYVRKMMVY
jgi:hypothetical protein